MKEFLFSPRNIYYRTNIFQSDRQTLVFVHGLSGSSSAWLPYEKVFKSTFNVLTFDLRGHGKSGKPPLYEEYKIENFADDLYELTEYLQIKKCTLVGHSLGSFVVLAFLQKHQEKVSKVIFFAPHFSVREMWSAKVILPFLWFGILLFKKLPFSEHAGRHIDYSRYQNTGDWSISRMAEDIGNTSMRVYLYATRQSYNFDGKNILERISIPTLIIHGRRDTIIPLRYGALMAQKIPGAKLVILEKVNHFPVLNDSKGMIEAIQDFIDKTS